MKQLLTRLTFVAAGAVVGIAASVTVSWLRPHAPGTSSTAPDRGELTGLDERLAALERAADGARAPRPLGRTSPREREPSESESDPDTDEHATAAAPRSDEEEAAAGKERFAHRQDEFAATPVDRDWSHQAVEKVGTGLAGAAETLGFEVARLECRNRNCLVELTWQRDADARRGIADLVHSTPGLNCAAESFVQASADSVDSISTTLLLRNCEDT